MELIFLKGFFTSAGLIMAIGAQNAFVLRQGLMRRHPGAIATCCFLVDALLIVAGIAGMGALLQAHPAFLGAVTLAGALFLTAYGLRALRDVFASTGMVPADQASSRVVDAILTTLALSLLNPHVYLDTVVLIGSIGGALPVDQQVWFGAGAVTASLLWFFSLAYGAAFLAPVLNTARAWRVLNALVAIIMFVIAAGLWWRFQEGVT